MTVRVRRPCKAMERGPIQIKPGEAGRLIVCLPYSRDLVMKIKTVAGRRWHQGEKYWTIPHTDLALDDLRGLFAGEPIDVDPVRDASHVAQHEKRVSETSSAMFDRLGTEKVCAAIQNQALAATLFLYRHVIGRDIGDLGEIIRARKPRQLPVVMACEEVKAVLANLTGDKWLMAAFMYGVGLRLIECLRLRCRMWTSLGTKC